MSDISMRIARLSPEQRSALESRVDRNSTAALPIAIIGLSCRFPGASNPKEFWELLCSGRDMITEVPGDRWDIDRLYDADASTAGKMNTRWGGFLTSVDQFDPHFFDISPREAARIDPQHRLLLETSWDALEDAGQLVDTLAGTQVGVFIGISTNDYARIQLSDRAAVDAYVGTGNALSIAANRISYTYNFRGPSVAVDTACSSSLVALHLACQSVWNKESHMALVGGVNLILLPDITINFSKAKAMAPDGRCKAFDARANGYVRGEGAGMVVLKPLTSALANGDPIYALIRGSAINNDGRTNGIMAPSQQAQEEVLVEAYRRAGVSPGDVQYVEAHGTGTLLGDPIEAKALGRVLAINRAPRDRCAIGSLKTNIGHLEAATGIAGVIKVALALHHRTLPPSLHFQSPNPHIPFDEMPLRVQDTLSSWPERPGSAFAGVSSFGFGGTNAHVVMESAPASSPDAERRTDGLDSHFLLPLSARSPEALLSLVHSYREYLSSDDILPSAPLADICYTAGARRVHHPRRLAIVAGSRKEFLEKLEDYNNGDAAAVVFAGQRRPDGHQKIAFVFPGQGSQWFGMCRELLAREPVFRQGMERCDQAVFAHVGWSVLEEINATESRSKLDRIDVIQPVLFSIQVALADLWRSLGVIPDAVVGHSMGEIAASCVAGALSLEDAAKTVCHRSRLLKQLSGRGGMMVVELKFKDAARLIAGRESSVSIAAKNSPLSTVLSGEPETLAKIQELLEDLNIFCRPVNVDVASHSPMVEPLLEALAHALSGLESVGPHVPIYSTVTEDTSGRLRVDGDYWVRNLRQPVLFSPAIRRMAQDGFDTFLELSPHPVLLSSIQQTLTAMDKNGVLLPSARRGEDERFVLLASLASLYAAGRDIDWSGLYQQKRKNVSLPSYPFQRQRCWFDTRPAANNSGSSWDADHGRDEGVHPLLGRRFPMADSTQPQVWQTVIHRERLPYLADHRVQGTVILPASAFVEIGLAAAEIICGTAWRGLADVEFKAPLVLSDEERRLVQTTVSSKSDGDYRFTIYSRCDLPSELKPGWTLHATGTIDAHYDDSGSRFPASQEISAIRERCDRQVAVQEYYTQLLERGLEYGPLFRGIESLSSCDGEALGLVSVCEELEHEIESYVLHPAALDSCLQVMGAAILLAAGDESGDAFLPVRIERVTVEGRPGPHLYCHARLRPNSDSTEQRLEGDLCIFDQVASTVVRLSGVSLQRLGARSNRGEDASLQRWLYEIDWRRQPLAPPTHGTMQASGSGPWIILSDSAGLGEVIAGLLRQRGETCVLIRRGACDREGLAPANYQMTPDCPEQFIRVLEAALGTGRNECRGIVHLWSLDADSSGQLSLASLKSAQAEGCESVINIAQAMAEVRWSKVPQLYLVTRMAQAVSHDAANLSIAQSPIWGLARTLAQEHPEFQCTSIDLDGAAESESAGLLVREFDRGSRENQVAFRGGDRYVARLIRSDGAAEPFFRNAEIASISSEATYLITGGLGGLGLAVAGWLAREGARHLVLMGRSEPSSDAERVAGELRNVGVDVVIAKGDVSCEADVERVLEDIELRMPPLKGLVHAAGVLRDRIVLEMTQEDFGSVAAPKILGAWNLHKLTSHLPLDMFVLFSSAASLVGSIGQSNYSAANAFMDALAHYRRAWNLPGLSINWGPWSGIGLAARADRGRRLAALGVKSIAPSQGLKILGHLLNGARPQAGAIPFDAAQWRRSLPLAAQLPMLEELMSEPEGDGEARPRSQEPTLTRDGLLAADPDQWRSLVESFLGTQVSMVLGLSRFRLDFDEPLNRLGLDSLMAVELKNRIESDLGVNVPLINFARNPSVAQLTTHVLDQFSVAACVSGVAGSRVPQPPVEAIGNSDWEVVKL